MRGLPAILFISAGLVLGATACEREGPAERAGKSVDRAVDKAGDTLERAGDKAQQRTDR